jgi:hypothetical protein
MRIEEAENLDNPQAFEERFYNDKRDFWEQMKHPYLEPVAFTLSTSFLIGFGIWMIYYDATQVIELDGWGIFLGLFLIILFGGLTINSFIQIRKYGLFGALRPIGFDPAREEPILLIKLRDPRVSMRRKCLTELLTLEEAAAGLGGADPELYVKRLTYCLIDKNPKIRRMACEILHRYFHEYLRTVATLLQYDLDLNFYLVDGPLRRRLQEEPIHNIRFCGNLPCFAPDEPCKSWPVSQIILTELDPDVYYSPPIEHNTLYQLKSLNHLNGSQIIGICRVCNLPLYDSEETEECPSCAALMHKTHFLEWLKIKGYCPNCKTHIPLVQHTYSSY